MNKEEAIREIDNLIKRSKDVAKEGKNFHSSRINDFAIEALMYLKCDNLEMAIDRIVEGWKFMIRNNIQQYVEN